MKKYTFKMFNKSMSNKLKINKVNIHINFRLIKMKICKIIILI